MEHYSNKKPKVLIADDEEDLLLLMKTKLQHQGFQVDAVPNAEHIYERIRSDRPDVIILDITMNGMDGGEICRQLKSDFTTKDIPIILFSANTNIRTITEQCGADAWLAKPHDTRQIKNKLMEVLGKRGVA